MRTLTQTGFADDTYTVMWCACEWCGAPGPCVTGHGCNPGVSDIPRARSAVGGCCGRSGLRPIRRGERELRDAAV